jgi:transcriptional regulator with XRE-family HTH domain
MDVKNLTLAQLRNLNKMNQSEIAEKLKLSPAGFRRKENGENPFYFKEVKILKDIYSLSYEELEIVIDNTIEFLNQKHEK